MCCVVGETVAAANRRASAKCHPACPFVFISIVVFITLIVLSNVHANWTLNPGETRQIKTHGSLNDELTISTNIPDAVNVYDLGGKCPPLTGPTVSFGNTEEIVLAQGDYEYDYFFLNEGSFIDVTLTQEYGATNIYIMKGLQTLEDPAGGGSDDDNSFPSAALLQRYAGDGKTAHIQYTVPHSDTYMVVYDNASASRGLSTVVYDVQLTTYNLKGKTPVDCSGTMCSVDVDNADCVVVQAKAEVTLQVDSSRSWGAILMYSALPLVIGLWCIWRRKQDDPADNAGEDFYPPATAPVVAVAEPLLTTTTTTNDVNDYPIATAIPEPLPPPPSAPFGDSKV